MNHDFVPFLVPTCPNLENKWKHFDNQVRNQNKT